MDVRYFSMKKWVDIFDMLAYINAGHEPLFLINKNGKMEKLKPTGPAVGLLQDTEYTPETISFEPGDALVGYTDGVTEARSPMDEIYSRRRLQKSLENDPVASADKILENIQADLFRFTEDATQSDDITIIVGGDLNFDMAGIFDKSLHINIGITKGSACFALSSDKSTHKPYVTMTYSHAFAATTSLCFQDKGVAYFFCDCQSIFFRSDSAF